MDPNEIRQTGRTTRILASAIAYAVRNPDKKAIFVVHNNTMVHYVRVLAENINAPIPPNFMVALSYMSHQYRGIRGKVFEDHMVQLNCDEIEEWQSIHE